MPSDFIYHTPSPRNILILASYLYLLHLFGRLGQKLVGAGLLGEILVGIIWGSPLAGLLDEQWQETLVVVGYVGLLLLVFGGGMATSLPTLIRLLPLSFCIAITGLLAPIAFSFLLIPMFTFPAAHALAAGSALSSTSLGTTLAVITSPSIGFNLQRTKLGAALMGAAVMDDVVAFVLSGILNVIGSGQGGIGADVGRAIGVTIGLGLIIALLSRYVLGAVYVKYWIHPWRKRGGDGLSILILAVVFIGSIAASGYAGTSPLYGVYLGGLAVSHLTSLNTAPSGMKQSDHTVLGPVGHRLCRSFSLPARLIPTVNTASEITTLPAAFERFIRPMLDHLLLPIFFGSIGYSIPFIPLFRPHNIWRGIIYASLMLLGKAFTGIWIWVWPLDRGSARKRLRESWWGGILLGSAMIARGEIGLLISQIAYNTDHPLLTEDEFLISIWAIVLCTIAGPAAVGYIIKRKGRQVIAGGWGRHD